MNLEKIINIISGYQIADVRAMAQELDIAALNSNGIKTIPLSGTYKLFFNDSDDISKLNFDQHYSYQGQVLQKISQQDIDYTNSSLTVTFKQY